MDEEMDDDQKSRKLAIKGLIAHLGVDDGEDQGDDGLGKDFMADSFANLAKKKSKGKGGGGGGGMPGMGGGGGGGGGGGMDLSSLSSLTSMI